MKQLMDVIIELVSMFATIIKDKMSGYNLYTRILIALYSMSTVGLYLSVGVLYLLYDLNHVDKIASVHDIVTLGLHKTHRTQKMTVVSIANKLDKQIQRQF